MRAMPSATDSTVPTSVSSASPWSRPLMRLLRIEVISSGLICMSLKGLLKDYWSDAGGDRAPQALQPGPDRGVEDLVADLQDDAADDLGVDRGGQLDVASGLLADSVAEGAGRRRVERSGRGDQHRELAVFLIGKTVKQRAYAAECRHAVLLHEQLDEVAQHRIEPGEHLVELLVLLRGREVRREEERTQIVIRIERVGDLAELGAHDVHFVLVVRHSEQRAGVHVCDFLHRLALSPTEGREVELAERFVNEALLIVSVERTTRDLFRGRDREVGDLTAQLLLGTMRRGLNVASGLREDFLTLLARLGVRINLVLFSGTTSLRRDLVGLHARSGKPLAVLGDELVGLELLLFSVCDRVLNRLLTNVERLGDLRERLLTQQQQRDAERDQRPDHQADVGRDQERSAAGCGDRSRSEDCDSHRPRGRTRSDRR